jgi:K+-transporting ATPase ATPase C chain
MLRPLLSLLLGGTLLLGLVVPLGFTALAGLVAPELAGGSPVTRNGQVIGSALIGQGFAGPRWFQPRPSATTEADPATPGATRAAPYNAAAGAASQLGPTSAALVAAVRERVAAFGAAPAAADAVTASASGLDPHISPANARAQVPRIAAALGLPPARILQLVEALAEPRELGLLGEPRVNVLRLNLALEATR